MPTHQLKFALWLNPWKGKFLQGEVNHAAGPGQIGCDANSDVRSVCDSLPSCWRMTRYVCKLRPQKNDKMWGFCPSFLLGAHQEKLYSRFCIPSIILAPANLLLKQCLISHSVESLYIIDKTYVDICLHSFGSFSQHPHEKQHFLSLYQDSGVNPYCSSDTTPTVFPRSLFNNNFVTRLIRLIVLTFHCTWFLW